DSRCACPILPSGKSIGKGIKVRPNPSCSGAPITTGPGDCGKSSRKMAHLVAVTGFGTRYPLVFVVIRRNALDWRGFGTHTCKQELAGTGFMGGANRDTDVNRYCRQ